LAPKMLAGKIRRRLDMAREKYRPAREDESGLEG